MIAKADEITQFALHADELRHAEVLGRGAKLDAERRALQQQRHPDEQDDRDDPGDDLEPREQHALDLELVRQPRVGLDALLRPCPDAVTVRETENLSRELLQPVESANEVIRSVLGEARRTGRNATSSMTSDDAITTANVVRIIASQP